MDNKNKAQYEKLRQNVLDGTFNREISAQIDVLRRNITDDILGVIGISDRGWWRRILGPFVWPPAQKFARLSAEFDNDVAAHGFRVAAMHFLQRHVEGVQTLGADQVPEKGPLLVASNHPGLFDGLAILSNIRRNDMKLVITGGSFFRSLPATGRHLIYTPSDTHGRMNVVRSMIRHLKDGGGLLIFPTGKLDPDPDILPGAEEALDEWSPSLELVLRRVPQTQVLVTIVSGVLDPSCFRNPLTALADEFLMKLRVAEFIQVVQELFAPGRNELFPKVSFGDPESIDELIARMGGGSLMEEIIKNARQLLAKHTEVINGNWDQDITGDGVLP